MTYLEALETKTWPTKDEGLIPISSMSDSNLIASYLKCVRDHWRLAFTHLLLAELESRGYRQSNPELFL